ncbi:MAG: DNA mismatch repair protein MutS [Pseudomonadota bacterium]
MARRSNNQNDDAPAPAAQKAQTGVTPSMAQYLEIKAANPDSLLWYRMGDFYELFFTDAVVAAEALGIVLTKRGKHLGEDIPMCGVPVVRADEYLQRLIRQGFRVAVCEQLEDPTEARKRGSKAIVKRDVVRLVTPGTLTEDALLDAKTRNYLTAIFAEPGEQADYALASLDISTGEFEIGVIAGVDLTGELVRLLPGEILSVDAVLKNAELERTAHLITAALTPVPAASFDSLSGERLMCEYLNVADLGAFGEFSRGEKAAVGALLTYVELTQLGRRPTVRPPRRSGRGATMIIDAASRASLEILRSTSGDRAGSLLASIDRTVTGPGARELASWISSPLRDLSAITSRQDAVAFMVDDLNLRDDIQKALRSAPDVARAISRLSLQRGGPRDLAAVRDAIAIADVCADLVQKAGGAVGLPSALATIAESLSGPPDSLSDMLRAAIVDEPPPLRREGGFVRNGYNQGLDDALSLRDDSRNVMASLEAKYAETSGVKSLKVRHNNILGYFIEVTAANAKPLMDEPLSDLFRHRQTMANAVRFTTVELSEIEGRIASAAERALAIENDIFAELANAISEHEVSLNAMASALAELDCVTALGELAVDQNYTRPIVDDSLTYDVRGGRHPVVEQALKKELAGPFIDNDCCLIPYVAPDTPPGFDDPAVGRIWLVTGPNMAGKSTFLRQNALITLLAQIGSYVPARSAHIGIVDRLFSRVGASDDIASGRSTFMVEMVETAAILNQATERSFVILDEIGRGTATFDGLSIAWATVEHLHDVNRCRALFATHYHELTTLADRLGEIANVTVDVKEWKDEIVFLHKVKPGAADRSYGIHVARLAGLPSAVTVRAGEVLELLEKEQTSGNGSAALDELPLFAAVREVQASQSSPLEDAMGEVNPDELTPRSALELVYRLKEISRAADE